MKTTINFPLSRILLLSILCAGITVVTAKEVKEIEDTRNPLGCYDTGYQFYLKTLHLVPAAAGKKQAMFFLFNSLNQKINLYQMRDEESSRSMFLNHSINARQWAALSTTEKQVKFICTVSEGKGKYGKVVDCGDSLQVCEFTGVRYGLNNRGNFWLVNSNTRGGALSQVVHYGIIP